MAFVLLVASFLQLLFLDNTSAEVTSIDGSSMELTGGSVTTIWVTFVAVILTILVMFACGIIARKFFRRNRKSETMNEDEAETSVMLTSFREVADISSANTSDMRNQFRKELQQTYRHLYDVARRTPNFKDKNSFAERVLVESGLRFIGARQESGGLEEPSNLKSYKDIIYLNPERSSLLILEGEPGYGKSTLALQLAYDWCNSTERSYLNDVEILIVLHLRQCQGVGSIYTAIKKFVLPKNTGFIESDLKNILQQSKSVIVILDGFDEYSEYHTDANSDIFKIIARKMLKGCRVVLTTTTSCLPHKYPSSTKRVMLTGFDDKARRNYISKALLGDDSESALEVLEYLKQNAILNDICQVPFLFVQFAHMTQDNSRIRQQHSVTYFFHQMMPLSIEHDHPNLAKIAFEALNGKSQKLIWTKKELLQKLGQKDYETYIGHCVLVEQEEIHITDGDGTSTNNKNESETEVTFYHKILQEWYAAHYLKKYLQQNPSVNLGEFLKHLSPLKHQYLYRFACGLGSQSACKVIEYLRKIEGDENFVILCMLEQSKDVESIIGTIGELCSEGINISGSDSLLQQRMSVNILEIAKQNEISVKGVHLQNCIKSIDLSTPAIVTLSNMTITSDIPVKNLSITLTNRNLEDQEAEDILEFAAQCQSLRLLVFGSCLPPYSFKILSVYSTMKSRHVKVGWRLFDDYPFYILNLNSGRWQSEKDGRELSKDEYEKMYLKRQDASKMWTEQYNIEMAKADRQFLRKAAAK